MAILKYRDRSTNEFVTIPALMGPPGASIESITQTNAIGPSAKNTITITTTDGTSQSFNYYNGAGISNIERITNNQGASAANTIRVTCTDNTTFDFQIYNGPMGPAEGITSIYTKDDSPGFIYYRTPGTTSDETQIAVGAPAEQDSSSTKVCVLGVLENDHSKLRYNTNVYVNCATGVLMGAAWNDYAEYRETKQQVKAGRVVFENGDDTLSLSYDRMIPACAIVSDTFGFAIGETKKAKTPLAMAGRVLAYPNEDRNSYKPGDAVCSGPHGTVSKMSQEEKIAHPECIIGYVSCVPTYKTWGEKEVKVDGRIWIKIL